MKRKMLLLTLLTLFVITGNVNAQNGISFQVNYYSDTNPKAYASNDIREFHAFQRDVADFSRAIHRDRVRKAKHIKRDVLRRMKDEIKDTRSKIRYAKKDLRYNSYEGLHHKRSKKSRYSKRSGGYYFDERRIKALNRQLRIQRNILYKLETMHLSNGRNFHSTARKHELLMIEFEEILKADISHSFKDYRYKYRNRKGY